MGYTLQPLGCTVQPGMQPGMQPNGCMMQQIGCTVQPTGCTGQPKRLDAAGTPANSYGTLSTLFSVHIACSFPLARCTEPAQPAWHLPAACRMSPLAKDTNVVDRQKTSL